MKTFLLAFLFACSTFGAQQVIINAPGNPGGTNDTLKTAFDKINNNFTNLFNSTGAIGDNTSITNAAGVITPVVGRTLPSWFNVKDPPYNAVLDGATDDSVAIQTAVNTASSKRGGIVYIPGPAKFGNPTILVTNDNITFLGQTPNLNDSAASTNFWIPASITSPMITFGNGTYQVKGGGISSATFYGTSGSTNGQTAIRFAGNANQLIFNSTFVGFRTNLIFLPSGSQSVTGVRMMGGRLHPHSSDTNQALVYLKMPDNQSPFVTDNVFDSVKVAAPQTIGSAGFLVDGTTIGIYNSYIDQGATNSSIRLRATGTGQLTPFVSFSGSTLDPTQTNWVSVLEDVSTGRAWETYLRGSSIGLKGRLQVSDGTQIEGASATVELIPYRSLASSIKIDSELAFDDGTSTAQWPSASTLKRIYSSGNDLVVENPQGAFTLTSSNNINLRTTNGVIITPLGNAVNISQGNLQLSNSFGIQFGGTNATQETALGQTVGNNIQLKSPSSGGAIQLDVVNPSNVFQILFGVNKLVQVDSNSFNITSNKLTVGGNQVYPQNPGANVTFTTNTDGTMTVAASGGGTGDVVAVNNNSLTGSNNFGGVTVFNGPMQETWTNLAGGTVLDYAGKPNVIKPITANLTLTSLNEVNDRHLRVLGTNDATGGYSITFNLTGATLFVNATNQSITPPNFPTNAGAVWLVEIYRILGTNYILGPSAADSKLLTYLANSTGNGMLSKLASDRIEGRTITGTANEIALVNGDGIAGNPVASLPSALTLTGKTITGGTYVSPVGLVTSVTAGHGLQTYSGTAAITSSDTAEIGFQVNAQSGTTYTVTTNDWGKMVTTTNASAIAVTLPQASSTTFQNGFVTMIRNIGPSLVTITPTTSKIDNGTTITLANGFGSIIVSDGANYWTKGLPYNGVDLTTVQTLQNKTISTTAAGGNNTLKEVRSLKFTPGSFVLVDNAGCTIPNTNDYTLNTFMVPQFSGSGASNANFMRFMCRVPKDIDTSVAMLGSLTIELTATDTGAQIYHVGVVSVANSAVIAGTAANYAVLNIAADASGASTDVESVNNVSLTGWAAALTANQWMVIELRRDGTDASTIASRFRELEIFYNVLQ